MKRVVMVALVSLMALVSMAQEKTPKQALTLPCVDIKTLKGNTFNTRDIQNDGKPIILCFFATWCKPCMTELKNISDEYADWQDETGVKIYAVSIDDSRSSSRVAPLVKGQGWDYEILLDENSDFKRALNVNDIPHTFIINGKGEIVWQHASYAPGVEQEYIDVVKKLINENK